MVCLCLLIASCREGEYEVESITNKRMVNGNVEYLVHWKGYNKLYVPTLL